MSAVCIIPARGGSRRIPRKNERKFHGRPIIYYSIKAAQESQMFSKVIVSTEDDRIGRLAEGYGVTWYQRPMAVAEDSVGTQDVAADVLRWCYESDDPYEFACVIYATSPLMDVGDLRNAFALLGQSAYAYSICGWHDAAQFYWGHARAFLDGVPLDHWSTRRFHISPDRFCDINVEADWLRAELMYEALHREKV